MPTKSILETLPDAINDEFIEKVLTSSGDYVSLTRWLIEKHGIKIGSSSVFRFSKIIRNKFGVLVKLGMPVKEIVKHRRQIEALGIDQVVQQILDKMAEKIGSPLAYLDEKEGSQ